MKTATKFLLAGLLICPSAIAFWALHPQVADAAVCNQNASRQCISNIVYWYDSCGAVQSIYQNCNATNQICQNAQCVNKAPVATQTPVNGANHVVKSCYNGNLHWFGSNGMVNDLYRSCADNNSCTLDDCAGNQCVNQLKCDGTTCAANSADYVKYCGGSNSTAPTPTPTSQNPAQIQNGSLVITLFGKKASENLQWEKSITAVNNDKIDFVVTVKNVSNAAINNATIRVDIANNVTYVGNLKIDNVPALGNVSTGIDVGAIAPKASKSLSFTGAASVQTTQNTIVQVTASANVANTIYDSDYVLININPPASAATAAISNNSFFSNFSSRWIWWLIVVAILAVIFVIIFRKLSSE